MTSGSLSGGSAIATLTSISNPLITIPSASVSAILGSVSFVTGVWNKIILNKIRKSEEILATVKSKINSIEKILTEAIDDMKISAEEHILCLNELDSYQKLKQDIRLKFKTFQQKSHLRKRDGK